MPFNPKNIPTGESLHAQALRYHKIGDLDNAERYYREAITIGHLHEETFSNLGVICKNQGRLKEAKDLYKKAILINPRHPDAYINLGILCNHQSENKEALSFALKGSSLSPENLIAHMSLGCIYKDLGALDKSLLSLLKVLELNPANATAHLNLGSIYKDLDDLEKALESTLKSLDLNPASSTAHLNLGAIYKDRGDLEKALESTLKSLEFDPSNTESLLNLGNIYKELGDINQALACTLKALQHAPQDPRFHLNLGVIYEELSSYENALESTLKSLEINPGNAHAMVNLGIIYKNLGRLDEAKAVISDTLELLYEDIPLVTLILDFYDSINDEESLEKSIKLLKDSIKGGSIRIIIFESRLLYRRKEYASGIKLIKTIGKSIEDLKDWFTFSKYHLFKGLLLEKNGDYDGAYNDFSLSQLDPRYKSLNHKAEHTRIHEYVSLARKMSREDYYLDPNIHCSCKRTPVFLIGFPRSGTTLLDVVLSSHPEIKVLEEKDSLSQAEKHGKINLHRQISEFNTLAEGELNSLREIYIARLNHHSCSSGKLVIDKFPLNTIAVPLIKLLFPSAKIVFAARHPCDAILSCFQQSFRPNPAMANFTTLRKSVDFYLKVMSSWREYERNLRISCRISKYEDLVLDFNATILSILNFLDLEWDSGIDAYIDTAVKRRLINTPSASQVVQPIYSSSVGRWKNYETHFSEYMEVLEPWIRHFGYDA